ncbi:hypothetical protein Halha_1720 [Halobacteroides halobius DSM 5150]|uniref:Uncharacterized protein n=1 Tax=Halobacteroides halobius (strain ATCC 35273 / DSM 5150 / MD-1) TaxID=748449 RepID=L0K8P3_HALHC|nr:hypothetical protein [Halobacteroides halobius]AGB41657.1 hypothetical protein Halha_1720 [Halobacteroides halobius DSM 5150]
MKKIYKQLIMFWLWIVSNVIGFVIFMMATNVVNIRMLKSGYLEGAGAIQFTKVYIGIPVFLLLAIVWLGSALFTYHYYDKGVKKDSLVQNFSLVTAVEMYLFPLIILIYQLAFPLEMMLTDWVVVSVGLVIGSISLYFYRLNNQE